MSKIESLLIGSVVGFVPPVLLALAGWWLSISLVAERDVWKYALAGLAAGTVVDVVFLPRWIRSAYHLSAPTLVLLYLFYMIGVFGFFMGVPVFNLLPGIAAGLYVGRKMRLSGADPKDFDTFAMRTGRLVTCVLLAFCIASAGLALMNASTGSDVRRMLGLSFEVTRPMIVGLILLGGSALLVGQYVVTRWSARVAFRYSVTP